MKWTKDIVIFVKHFYVNVMLGSKLRHVGWPEIIRHFAP